MCISTPCPSSRLNSISIPAERNQPHSRTRLELHQHIHVAVRPEIIAQHLSEQRQAPNVIPPAKLGELIFHNSNFHTHVCTSANIRALDTGFSTLVQASH